MVDATCTATISDGAIERIALSNGSERELLCETLFGKSYAEFQPWLEYELFLSKINAGKWMVTDVSNTCCGDDTKITIGAISLSDYGGQMYFEFRPYQLDERFVNIMRRVAEKCLGRPACTSEEIEQNPLVQLAKNMVCSKKTKNEK